MNDSKIIVTVSGQDKTGIVSGISAILAEYKVNIEDIRQSIMQDQFVMFLMADISNSKASYKELKQALLDKCEELGMEIWVQRKAIFDKMHTI